MNKLSFKILRFVSVVCAMALILTPRAHASLLLEPYLGYHTGTVKNPNSVDMSGVSMGGRLGLQNLGLMGGIDYMTGSWTAKSTPSATVTPSDLSVFVGFNFPIMLRVYAEYGLSSALKFATSAGNDTDKGTNIKLGVGFTTFPLISINVEYIAGTYTKHDGGSLNPTVTDSMLGLTVSLPLTF